MGQKVCFIDGDKVKVFLDGSITISSLGDEKNIWLFMCALDENNRTETQRFITRFDCT